MSENPNSYPKMIKIERPCHYCRGTGVETREVDENYRTKDGFKVNAVGEFMMFALGHCSECGKYVAPGFMIYDGDPCPLCGKPFWRKDDSSPKQRQVMKMNRYHLFAHINKGLDRRVVHESIYNNNQGERDLMVRVMQLLSEDADICIIYGEDITDRIKEGL